MGREVVTGYCWPQSGSAGEPVGLHMSSSGGRPVRIEVARVGARREVVFRSDAVAADEHETSKDASSEAHPEVLDDASLYLSVGHDEYWSRGMRDTVEAFIARGGNAAFFSGNTSLWQVRIEGDDHDVMVGYEGFFKDDPLMVTGREPEVTTFWSDVVVGRPENHMTGVTFTRGG